MREIVNITQQGIGSILWLLQQAWHIGSSFAARIAAAWPEGQLWKQIGFVIIGVVLAYATFIVSRRMLKGVHYVVNLLSCVLVLLMAIVPTVAITILALAGGFWIAKSF